MGTDPRTALRRLTDPAALEPACRRHGVRVLTAFGSAVRPDTTPADLDVAVLFEPGHSHDALGLIDSRLDLQLMSR